MALSLLCLVASEAPARLVRHMIVAHGEVPGQHQGVHVLFRSAPPGATTARHAEWRHLAYLVPEDAQPRLLAQLRRQAPGNFGPGDTLLPAWFPPSGRFGAGPGQLPSTARGLPGLAGLPGFSCPDSPGGTPAAADLHLPKPCPRLPGSDSAGSLTQGAAPGILSRLSMGALPSRPPPKFWQRFWSPRSLATSRPDRAAGPAGPGTACATPTPGQAKQAERGKLLLLAATCPARMLALYPLPPAARPSQILSRSQVAVLSLLLPDRLRNRSWFLVYSTHRARPRLQHHAPVHGAGPGPGITPRRQENSRGPSRSHTSWSCAPRAGKLWGASPRTRGAPWGRAPLPAGRARRCSSPWARPRRRP